MKESINVNIGLIGFGTVGNGVYRLIKNNSEVIQDRSSVNVNIKSICDLRVDDVKKEIDDDKIHVTANYNEVLSDPDIDTVVELIGGIEPAKKIIIEALKAGKNVVTANKKLLAESGDEIFELSDRKDAKLGFEASVCGGIPCLLSVKHGMVGNRIKSVMGILNGTSNYILTKMGNEGLSFKNALSQAQAAGFAEADPTFDIEGYDTGHKISILAMLAFNKKVDYKSIQIEGITKIDSIDIAISREMGYVIKLLGIAKREGDEIDIRVHPTLVRNTHQLASVHNEFNAVLFDNDMTGHIALYGKGAGSLPTASAVVSDIVQIAVTSDVKESAIRTHGDCRVLPVNKRFSRFYLRMRTEDRAGILEKIAGAFAEYGISISSLVQKEGTEDSVPIILMTHRANESKMMAALEKINGYTFMKEKVVMIRVEE